MNQFRFTRDVIQTESSDIYDSKPPSDPFYELHYLKINPMLHEEDAEAKFQAIKKILKILLPIKKLKTIADIGCGSCAVLTKILDYLHKEVDEKISAVGIDISSQILLRCNKHRNLIKLRANCEYIPLENKSISLSLCIDIVEHSNDPSSLLKEVSRISEFAIFKIPLELCLYTKMKGNKRRLAKMKEQFGHIQHFSRGKILQLIQSHFDVIYEGYEKIPNRFFLLDKFQELLIKLGLKQLFAFLFGGFVILLTKSKPSAGVLP